MIRRVLPNLGLPLAIVATGLTAAIWLRTFPATTIGVPIFGAAVLSVLVSSVAVTLTRRSLTTTVPIASVVFVVYTLAIVLRDPIGFGGLIDGFRLGPARLLSFALPLVSPASLMVTPVALVWLVGLIAGEALTRRPSSGLPYPVWLIGFGIGYAGTARAYLDGHSNRTADALLGGGLLATLAALRLVQTWVQRNDGVVPTGSESLLPLRGLLVGGVVAALAVAVGAAGVQSDVLSGDPRAIQREPAVRLADPLTPLAFVASLRPRSPTVSGATLFTVNTDRRATAYLTLASVDYYDGDSWTFQRSFKPSGGVIPPEVDPLLDTGTDSVTQRYRITDAALVRAPWMPYLARPAKVSDEAVNVEAVSAMIVPSRALQPGATYTVRSEVPRASFEELGSTWLAATSPPPIDTQLPAAVRTPIAQAVTALADETGQPSTSPSAFLSALVKDLRANYALTDPSAPTATASRSTPARTTAGPTARTTAGPTAKPAATPSAPSSALTADPAAGGTSVAAVLASVLGDQRTGTPEQFATLLALVARSIGVPARVVSGFRLAMPGTDLLPGDHSVTTSQAHTWVEIPVRGAGWVVIDPSPTRYADAAAASSVGGQTSSPPSTAPPTDNALVTPASGGQAVAPRSTTGGSHGSGLIWLFWFVPAVIVGLVALLVLARWLSLAGRRRRRRNRPDPRAKVIGAWQESLDVLTAAGLGDLRPLTGVEVTTASEARFGIASAGAVAVLSTTADRALYSEHLPIRADDATTAWRAHDALRRSVRSGRPIRERVRAALGYRRRH